jgi:hypothetical protein
VGVGRPSEEVHVEIAIVVAAVLVLVVIQLRRRGSKLQRPEDPRAGSSS